MLAVLLVLGMVAVVAWIELPNVFRQRQWKEVMVIVLMLLAGASFSILSIILYKIQTPLVLIEVIYEPVNRLFGQWFS
ncbi:hypothetical protein MUG84_18545 [Paenibacillus sp. KQZ6P-2]|uniref:Uncharacterized protein n=1 Tax=Paenibacillus mangrovi TaxID=2931978 RepID=A0A9X1WX93_9BACL|nr:hypothetical protein [Paenibacillus mangrovi]MCJ8013729.1 hypothetical protein [Paenibacillus mangrovi]